MTSRFLPHRDVALLRRQMDRLFDDAAHDESQTSVWSPRADVVETDRDYLLALDLPGIDRDSLDVTLDDGTLKISGERQPDSTDGRMHRIERAHGRFFRSFTLGSDLDDQAIEAHYDDGVLTVRIGKAETIQPRRITVGSRADAQSDAQDVEVSDEVEA